MMFYSILSCVGTPVLKPWVEVLLWHSKSCLDKTHHFTETFQVHVTCFDVVKYKQQEITAVWPIWRQERGPSSEMCWLLVLPGHLQLAGRAQVLRLHTLVPSLPLQQERPAVWAEKWHLGSLNHLFKMQCAPGCVLGSQLWGSQVTAFVWLLLRVLVLSDESETVKSVMLLYFRFTQLCRLWRKIVPSAELAHTVGLFRPASGKIVSAFIYEIPIIEVKIPWNSFWFLWKSLTCHVPSSV